MDEELPEFPKPINWLAWTPLAVGALFCLQYLKSNPGLGWSWLAVGAGLAYFGHLFGTDKVKAYRVFQEYLAGRDLSRQERLEILREANGFWPHVAIRAALVDDLMRERDYKDAYPILENFPLEEVKGNARLHLLNLRAHVLFELGYVERAEYVLHKLLGESSRYLPALALRKRMENAKGASKTEKQAA